MKRIGRRASANWIEAGLFLIFTFGMVQPGHALLPLSPDYSSTYGSGNFGTWFVDSNGLPAYGYDNGNPAETGEFITAQPPFHLLGNTGTLLHTYADGYHVLFTSRTFPRHANYFRPSRQAWGGGFGWVYDRTANQAWSTYYPDKLPTATYDTTWGMGYARKVVGYNNVSVEETTFSPLGDDEVVMQKIVIQNNAATSKTISYYAYWDWDSYILRPPLIPGIIAPYYEEDPSEDYWLSYDAGRSALKAASLAPAGNLSQPDGLSDPSPKTAFLAFLNAPMTGYETVKSRVFSPGQDHPWPDAMNPVALTNSKSVWYGYNSAHMLFVAERRMTIPAGGSTTLYLLYGFTRRDQENAVIDAYRTSYANRLTDTINHFKNKAVKFTVPSAADKWLSREAAWNSYYMNAAITREDWFGGDAHTLNQNSTYLLDVGQNIAPRDQIQYAAAFIYANPAMAKEMLRYTLRTAYSDGHFAFGTGGYGADAMSEVIQTSSDHGLWPGWGVAEYVNATRDYTFLDETIKYNGSSQTASVYNALKKVITYQLNTVGTGPHGLVKILDADWADGLTKISGNFDATYQNGESVPNTALAIWIYPLVRELALRKGDTAFASTLATATANLRTALAAQWRTNMFNRAYLVNANNQTYELGGDVFWAEGNSFAGLAEDKIMTPAQVDALVAKILDSSTGAMTPLGLNYTGKVAPGYTAPGSGGAIGGGDTQWYSLSSFLIRGMANYADVSTAAKNLAWSEFKKSTLANHAALYPDQFYGLISGPDSYYTTLNDFGNVPGTSWLETLVNTVNPIFPIALLPDDIPHSINNMHSHTHVVYNAAKLAGFYPNKDGYAIKPAMPSDDGFGWESENFGLQYEPYAVTGKIKAAASETVQMKVTLTNELTSAPTIFVKRNGVNVSFTRTGDVVTFNLALTANTLVNWSITN